MKKIVIEVKNLTRKFGQGKSVQTAVDNISFQAYEGEVLGLLGPNGAGKTTTIFMLLDLLRPTDGQIRIFDLTHQDHHSEIMSRLNFSSTYVKMPGKLTVEENLYVMALLFSVPRPWEKVVQVLKKLHSLDLARKRYSFLSSGQRTRVGLAKALLNDPQLILLDEPTASLDPDVAEATRRLIKETAKRNRTTVLITSHNMAEVEEICDRLIFINHGRIVAEGSPLEVTRKILNDKNSEPDLGKVFIKIVRELNT